MDAIEKIAGETNEQLKEHDWPSKSDLKDFTWPAGVALRGSVRLAAGLTTDRKTIDKNWHRVSTALLKLLKRR